MISLGSLQRTCNPATEMTNNWVQAPVLDWVIRRAWLMIRQTMLQQWAGW